MTLRNSWYFVLLVVTLHLWGRIFKMFPVLRDLTYGDDEFKICRFSQVLKLTDVSNPVLKGTGHRSVGDPSRYRCLRQELRDLKLHKDNKGCGEV